MMKNLIFFTGFLSIFSTGSLLAQLPGKSFISGSAGINFNQSNPASAKNTNGYGYQFDVLHGKFKTSTRATGWRLSNWLGGGKNVYTIYPNNEAKDLEKSGITDLGFGVGRFWQFYKHFNAKTGIFAGPEINLGYTHGDSYTVASDGKDLSRNKTEKFSLYTGLQAGLYYRFSEKWWASASLAFADPFSIDYTLKKSDAVTASARYENKELMYRFSPGLSIPSVGFGLRYFYNR